MVKLWISLSIGILAVVLYQQQQQLVQPYLAAILTSRTSQLRSIFKSLASSSMSATTSKFPGLPPVPPNDPSLTHPNNSTQPRRIQQIFLAVEQAEGAGARVRRSVGTAKLRNFSPFLMLDHVSISPGAGFPDHPHRGQETITYLLSGAVDHEDFAGNRGIIWPGDLQFMTAGRGIMHAEMPHHEEDNKPIVGMQLWVDLPKHLKNCEPRYRDLRATEIPHVDIDSDKVKVKVISGQSHGVDSVQELAYTPVWFLDVTMQKGGKLTQHLPKGWNAFAYLLEGSITFDTGAERKTAPQYHNVVFEQDGDAVLAEAEEDSRMIIVAGTPLDQKVVQYGPFVVTSQEEVYQAMFDYQGHTNGFERAEGWRSEIGKVMMDGR